jgi:hypothetical protein
MNIKQAMKESKYGIFKSNKKTPVIWPIGKSFCVCLFQEKEKAVDFWINKNMAISFQFSDKHGNKKI